MRRVGWASTTGAPGLRLQDERRCTHEVGDRLLAVAHGVRDPGGPATVVIHWMVLPSIEHAALATPMAAGTAAGASARSRRRVRGCWIARLQEFARSPGRPARSSRLRPIASALAAGHPGRSSRADRGRRRPAPTVEPRDANPAANPAAAHRADQRPTRRVPRPMRPAAARLETRARHSLGRSSVNRYPGTARSRSSAHVGAKRRAVA